MARTFKSSTLEVQREDLEFEDDLGYTGSLCPKTKQNKKVTK